jgi:WD40 repeat protein
VDPENSMSVDNYAQMESISSNFWNVVNPTYAVRFVEVRSPLLVALDPSEETFEHLKELNDVYESVSAAKRAHESEMDSQSSLQRFTFQLFRRMVHIVLHINIASVLILMTLIGIILWMLPPYRQGFLEPMFQTFLARYGKYLVLAYISPKIPWAPLQRALKASKAAEYDKDGNHRGAISLQQGNSKRQNTVLGELRIVTLDGHHTGDIQSLHTSSSHGTIVSAGREGELVLWDGVRGKWVARLDRVQRRKDTKTPMGDINPEYTVGSFPSHMRFSPGHVRKIIISSPVRCIKVDQSNQWVACGHENGDIRVWNVSSSSWTRELSIATVTNGSTSSINIAADGSSSNGSEKPAHPGPSRTRQVMALAFIESFIPDAMVSDMPKLSRKQFSGKTNMVPSPNTYLVAAYTDGYLREWDIEAGECVNTIEPERNIAISHLLVVPGKKKSRHERHKVFVVNREGVVKCYGRKGADPEDLNQKPQWKSLYTIDGRHNQAISAISTESAVDGTGIVVTGTKKGSVQVWNFTNGAYLCSLAEGQVQKHQETPNKLSVRMPSRDESHKVHGRFSSLDENNESKQWNDQGDHHGPVHHITISRHCRSDRVSSKQNKVEQCHRNEYLVASSSTDGVVNVWRLTSNTYAGSTERCDQCGYSRSNSTFKDAQTTIPGYKSDVRNDIMQAKPQLQPNGTRHEYENNQATLAQENGSHEPILQLSPEFSTQDVTDIEQLGRNTEEFQVKKLFLGRVYQPGGFGAVWLRNTILAGVRRTNTRQTKSSKPGWELWMAPIRKYQPNRRQRHKDFSTASLFQDVESKYNIPVLTVNLDDDSNDLAEQSHESQGLVTRVLTKFLSSNAVPNSQRQRQASITKARRMNAVVTARLQQTRRKHRNSSVLSQKPDFDITYEEEIFAKELLPFSNLTCIEALDGDGLAFDFGNFIKVIWLDEMHQAYSVNEKDFLPERESLPANGLRPRRVAVDKPSTSGPSAELYDNDPGPTHRQRRSSSFSALPSQNHLLPCGVPDYGQCRPGSCGPSCKPEQPFIQQYSSHLVASKKFN